MNEQTARSATDAAQFLEEEMPVDEVPAEVIQEGKELLDDAGRMANNREFDNSRIQKFLGALTVSTSFDAAKVELRQYEKFGTRECFRNMMVTIGKQPGQYTVWFERRDMQWVLACSKVPAGGLLRGVSELSAE